MKHSRHQFFPRRPMAAAIIIMVVGFTSSCLSVTAKAPDIDVPILLGRVLIAQPAGGPREVSTIGAGKFNWKILKKESDSQCIITRDSSVSSNSKQHTDSLSRIRDVSAQANNGTIVYRVREVEVRARFGILPLIIYNLSTDLSRIDIEGSIRLISGDKKP